MTDTAVDAAYEAINDCRRLVMDLYGGNLDHPALDHLEAAMTAVRQAAMEKGGTDRRKGRTLTMPDSDVVESVVVLDLSEHFADLDDQEDALFGEYARVSSEGSVITVLHESEPWGIEITVKKITDQERAEGSTT